jgi:hypothetical protein
LSSTAERLVRNCTKMGTEVLYIEMVMPLASELGMWSVGVDWEDPLSLQASCGPGSRVSLRSRESARCTRPGHEMVHQSETSCPGRASAPARAKIRDPGATDGAQIRFRLHAGYGHDATSASSAPASSAASTCAVAPDG